jgi:antitoxin (DNA-binding transcriptional repressor) of toxin-antitoxin stability system
MSKLLSTQQNIIGVKELRENLEKYIMEVNKGKSFIFVRRLRPVFSINLVLDDENEREIIVDFTKVRKGEMLLKDILVYL